jgi:glycosyltransferase involved in cell wall biosynthesis
MALLNQRLRQALALKFHSTHFWGISRNQHAYTHRFVRGDYIILTSVTFKTSSNSAIVFVSLAYAPVIGGAERQAQALLERWASQGAEIWVLTRRVAGSPDQEVLNGVKVFRLWTLWLPVLSWMTFTFSVLIFLLPRRRQVGSLWSVMLNVTTLAVVAAARFLRRPAIVKISCSGEGGNVQVMRRSPGGVPLSKFLLKGCRRIIVLNDESITELQPYSLAPGTIKHIPNGVNSEVYVPASADQRRLLRNKIGLSENDVAVLFVGRLEEQKNLRNLLQVWPAVSRFCPQARLLLVGEGSEEGALKRLAAEQKVESSVRFLGKQTDVKTYYQASDLFILPSHFEGVANALLEAMACGLPVMVSRISGNQTVITKEEDAGWIDPSDPNTWAPVLIHWIQSPSVRQVYGGKARRIIEERFSMAAVLQQYQALHRELNLP